MTYLQWESGEPEPLSTHSLEISKVLSVESLHLATNLVRGKACRENAIDAWGVLADVDRPVGEDVLSCFSGKTRSWSAR